MPRDGWELLAIDDIGDIILCDSDVAEHLMMEIFYPVMIIVPYLDSYKTCVCCKARVESQSLPLGCCFEDDCSMMQRYNFCKEQLSAKIMFMLRGDQHVETLCAFGNMVCNFVAEDEDITPESLLCAPPLLKLMLNDKIARVEI